MLEKVMYSRLSQHLFVNKIIASEQFGFRKNSSTETAIYTLKNILKALDERSQIGIFCELAKAFDHLNNDILFDQAIVLWYGDAMV